MNVQPGDLIFYPDDGTFRHHIFAVMQEKLGELGLVKAPPYYTHAAMIANDPDLVVEMVWPRPQFRLFADDTRTKIVMRPKVDPKLIQRAIFWTYLNIDDHYSFLNMALAQVKFAKAYKCCSGWLDTAFKAVGAPLTSTGDDLISPCELASSKLLMKVEA